MKQKIGDCIDCAKKEVPIIAKRCGSCYWRYRDKVNKEKPKKEKKQEKLIWFQGSLKTLDYVNKKLPKVKEVRAKADKRQAKTTREDVAKFQAFCELVWKAFPRRVCVECGSPVPKKGFNVSHILSAQVLKAAYYDLENVAPYMCDKHHGEWHSSKKFEMDCYEELKNRGDKLKQKYHKNHGTNF